MVKTNGWDPLVLARFREDKVVQSLPGAIDRTASDEQLLYIEEKLIPTDWMEHAATGSPVHCAQRIREELEYGADKVILMEILQTNWRPY